MGLLDQKLYHRVEKIKIFSKEKLIQIAVLPSKQTSKWSNSNSNISKKRLILSNSTEIFHPWLSETDPFPKIIVHFHKVNKPLSIKSEKNSIKTSTNPQSSSTGLDLAKMTVFQSNWPGKIIKF